MRAMTSCFGAACLGMVLVALTARAADLPVVVVTDSGVTPARLEVHVGEVVTWRGPGSGRLRIALDDHVGAHEAAERDGEVFAVFRRTGEHRYSVRLLGRATRVMYGVVVVRETTSTPSVPDVCAPGSSARICFQP